MLHTMKQLQGWLHWAPPLSLCVQYSYLQETNPQRIQEVYHMPIIIMTYLSM